MKKILRYLSVKQLMEDIADLNGVMSVRRFVLSTMLAGVAGRHLKVCIRLMSVWTRLQWSGLGNICWRYLKVYN